MTRGVSRRIELFVVVLWAFAACVPASSAAEKSVEALEEQAFKQAAAYVSPSIVRILTTGGQDRIGRILTGTGPTTGVVVSADGYVISSAFNFASRPSSILVELPDERRFSARLVATDRARMLTLLKIDVSGLIPVQAAEKKSLRVGQWAIALGRTFNNPQPSMSVGIVSALKRIWGRAVQTDAKVSPVNYGGPLVDIQGRVIGILVPLSMKGTGATAGVEWYDSGIGFAIPMEDVYASLERLKTGKDLKPGLMGVIMRGRDFLAGKPIIDLVRAGSPAEIAGFKRGDVIVEIDGNSIRRQAEVKMALGNKYAGETVTVVVERKGKTHRAEVTLVDQLIAYESGFLGILPMREETGQATAGVGIRYVYPEGPAEKAGLQIRDRIMRFNESEITNAATLTDLVSRVRPGQKVSIDYRRDNQEKTVEVTLASIPNTVPAELRSSLIPSPMEPIEPDENEKKKGPRTGRFTVEMPNHQHSYWAYVPDDYNPDYEYGLMVWIHPNGKTMEADILDYWSLICQQRGLLLLAPKAEKTSAWNMNEAGFVKDSIEHFRETYSVNARRLFLHGFGKGGGFTYHLAFKYRDVFRGISVVNSALQKAPPENHPDYRLQFHLVSGTENPEHRAVESLVKRLQQMKYPASFTVIEDGDESYPGGEALLEIARW
ncbi:MAG: PDZ domain-containing protein, partial [Planctomycetes bacterium]|nr:PDZ domain-containing protein [Planctomycetota bacterium]